MIIVISDSGTGIGDWDMSTWILSLASAYPSLGVKDLKMSTRVPSPTLMNQG